MDTGVFKWNLEMLRVNTYILTSLARRASWTTSTGRTLRKWETHHFVQTTLINFWKKKKVSQRGRTHSQFDQVHQAPRQVLGSLEGPKRKQAVILQALV